MESDEAHPPTGNNPEAPSQLPEAASPQILAGLLKAIDPRNQDHCGVTPSRQQDAIAE